MYIPSSWRKPRLQQQLFKAHNVTYLPCGIASNLAECHGSVEAERLSQIQTSSLSAKKRSHRHLWKLRKARRASSQELGCGGRTVLSSQAPLWILLRSAWTCCQPSMRASFKQSSTIALEVVTEPMASNSHAIWIVRFFNGMINDAIETKFVATCSPEFDEAGFRTRRLMSRLFSACLCLLLF